MAEKIYIVITVARQVEGDFIVLRTEKGFKQASDADALVAKLTNDYKTADDKLKLFNISSGGQSIECYCSVGKFEVEVN